jgi:hypothetical protein
MSGKSSHCDTEPRAGQRKAARGKEGDRTSASLAEILLVVPSTFFGFRLGLWGEGEGPAIVAGVGEEGEELALSKAAHDLARSHDALWGRE